VKEAARIEALPLQSRNFLNILNFTPGVVSNGFAGQGQGYTRVGFIAKFWEEATQARAYRLSVNLG
jgi:hypothetical protein